MTSTATIVAGILRHQLRLTDAEARNLAGELPRESLSDIAQARRYYNHDAAGAIVPILLRHELSKLDTTDDATVCQAIDRARQRLAHARTHNTPPPTLTRKRISDHGQPLV